MKTIRRASVGDSASTHHQIAQDRIEGGVLTKDANRPGTGVGGRHIVALREQHREGRAHPALVVDNEDPPAAHDGRVELRGERG